MAAGVDDDYNNLNMKIFSLSAELQFRLWLIEGQSNPLQINFGLHPFTMPQTFSDTYWIPIFTPHEDVSVINASSESSQHLNVSFQDF